MKVFVKVVRVVAMLALSFGAAQIASAETDVGIGVSVQSDDSIIYVPIDFNQKFRLEPSLRYIKSEQKFSDSFGDDEFDQEVLEVGVGLFGLGAVGEKLRVYYGGRVAYVRAESDSTSTVILFNGIVSSSFESESDGYRISPTIGFEYLINDRFSIGAEAEYFFQDVDGDEFSSDRETSGTDTRLIVRFKF